MSDSTKSPVNKLLRVLVAGGVALAGVAGTARAEEKEATPAQKTEKPKEAEKAKTAEKPKAAEKGAKEKKADKPSEQDGGGVKGW
jgi:hypothetical protein